MSSYFFYYNTFYASPIVNPVEPCQCRPSHMSLWDLELHGYSYIFSFGVTRSGPEMSSTTNHMFCMALGRLHDPWCKTP